MDSSPEFERVFTEMEQSKICAYNSFFYQNYALFLEAKGKLIDAFMVYQLGISRFFISLSLIELGPVCFVPKTPS